MTALVTGGCGFIGRHLVSQLRARGDAVRLLDLGPFEDLPLDELLKLQPNQDPDGTLRL